MVAKRTAQQLARRLFEQLEEKYGSALKDEPRSILSQLMFNIIARNWTRQGAQKVFDRLQQNFVDWNEVRISSFSEISGHLESEGAPNAINKAKNIKKILVEIYRHHHKITLDFLKENNEAQAKEILEGLPGASRRVVDSVLLFALDYPVVPLYSPIARVCKRVGIVEHSASQEEIKQTLMDVVPKKDLERFSRLVIDHGERTCTITAPRCKNCVLSDWCPEPERQTRLASEAKTRAKARAAETKAEAATRAAAEKAAAAEAKKGGKNRAAATVTNNTIDAADPQTVATNGKGKSGRAKSASEPAGSKTEKAPPTTAAKSSSGSGTPPAASSKSKSAAGGKPEKPTATAVKTTAPKAKPAPGKAAPAKSEPPAKLAPAKKSKPEPAAKSEEKKAPKKSAKPATFTAKPAAKADGKGKDKAKPAASPVKATKANPAASPTKAAAKASGKATSKPAPSAKKPSAKPAASAKKPVVKTPAKKAAVKTPPAPKSAAKSAPVKSKPKPAKARAR